MAGLLSIALFAGQAATIPQPFQGNWATTPAACGGEDTKGVIITPTTVNFYEAKGVVQSASLGAKGASAHVKFQGEGQEWFETIRFRIPAEGRLELRALGKSRVFERCR